MLDRGALEAGFRARPRAAVGVPDPSLVRERYACGPARGFRYGAIPADVERALPRWVDERRVADGATIKDGAVYRTGAWLVKFEGASPSVKDALRPASSIRIADLHARLQPVRTPAPLVALEMRRGAFLDGSLLVTEFIEGATLFEAFGRDERAVRALAPFLATLHRRGVFHGDLHPWNLIWSGTEWVLIDLASLRHPLRTLRRKHLILDQFAEFAYRLGDDERVRGCFEQYLAAARLDWDPRGAWDEIVRRAEILRARLARLREVSSSESPTLGP